MRLRTLLTEKVYVRPQKATVYRRQLARELVVDGGLTHSEIVNIFAGNNRGDKNFYNTRTQIDTGFLTCFF